MLSVMCFHRGHGGPRSVDDELQLPSTLREPSEPNGRTLHLCPYRSAQAPLPQKSRHYLEEGIGVLCGLLVCGVQEIQTRRHGLKV